MVQRHETVGSILSRWHQARAHYLPWPDELMQSLTESARLDHANRAMEAEWEKDWIDIGGEG